MVPAFIVFSKQLKGTIVNKFSAVVEKELAVEPGTTVYIRGGQKVEVRQWGQSQVKIVMEKEVKALSNLDGKAKLDSIVLDMFKMNDKVVVTLLKKNISMHKNVLNRLKKLLVHLNDEYIVHLKVYLPEGVNINLDQAKGMVSIQNISGNLRVVNTAGNIKLFNVKGNIRAITSSGKIEFVGRTRQGQRVFLKSLKGEIVLNYNSINKNEVELKIYSDIDRVSFIKNLFPVKMKNYYKIGNVKKSKKAAIIELSNTTGRIHII